MKLKTRNLKISLVCKRSGVAPNAFILEWKEHEDQALETYDKFWRIIQDAAKAHGLMRDAPAMVDTSRNVAG